MESSAVQHTDRLNPPLYSPTILTGCWHLFHGTHEHRELVVENAQPSSIDPLGNQTLLAFKRDATCIRPISPSDDTFHRSLLSPTFYMLYVSSAPARIVVIRVPRVLCRRRLGQRRRFSPSFWILIEKLDEPRGMPTT